MGQRVRSPFAGFPATWQVNDRQGNPIFYIEPRILTPFRAIALSYISKLAVIAGIGHGLLSAASTENPDAGMFVAAFVVPVVLVAGLYKPVKYLFRKRVRIMMTQEKFSVRRMLGWRHYDRELPHRFALLPHDWVQAELESEDYRMQQAQLKRQALKKERWYSNSFHISFDYLGQRNDLMTVYGQKEAVAVAMRLKACDDVLDAFSRRGHGTPLSPEKEWHDQPGEIPETV